ncbi:MAG: response regulator [Planctomycetes bacterium]|nr:response regulator [Planctomycetota bacterium]
MRPKSRRTLRRRALAVFLPASAVLAALVVLGGLALSALTGFAAGLHLAALLAGITALLGIPLALLSFRLAASRLERDNGLAALRVDHQRLAALVGNARDGIITVDAAGVIRSWNGACERIFGYTAEEAVGREVTLIMPERLRARHAAAFRGFVAQAQAREKAPLEQPALCKNGREILVEISLTSCPAAGEFLCAAVVRDVTQNRRNRDALMAAMEEATASCRAKSSFLATMSHEIRTPMNGVVGMTDLLLETQLTEEQRGYAETVWNCADALLTLINDILDFSKIEAGRLELERTEFDLVTLIEDVADLLACRAQEKGLCLANLIDPGVQRYVIGDPGRLRQILVNLTGNAIKFTEKGEVTIRCLPLGVTENEMRVRLSVTDTGIGISEKARGRLFQAFSQVDASNARRFGGTGLGLAISKQLVELMGGAIGLESEEGKGSTFWFTVNLEKQPEESRAPIPEIDLNGRRVLVADGHATSRESLRVPLAKWGCRVAEADTASAALEQLRRGAEQGAAFDLALVDLHVPDAGGEALGRQIKSDPAIAGTPLVLLAAVGMRGDAMRAKEAGFAGYLTKPLRTSLLFDCLAVVLGEARAPAPRTERRLVTRHLVSEERRGRVRILVAEDNPVNQRVALLQLKRAGFRADTVANGKEAVEALQREAYDIVLMDCHMPEMDGYEATRVIRSSATERRRPTIIAMTASAMEDERRQCFEAGMDDFISKPVKAETLVDVLDRWTAQERAEQPAS